MKNKVVMVLLVIALFIPTVVSVVYYNNVRGGAADAHNTLSVTLRDVAGTTFVFDREAGEESEEMIRFLLALNENAAAVSDIPPSVAENDFYQATFNTSASETSFKYYFSLSAADCFMMDGDGKAYQIAEKDAQKFLEGPYAASLYEYGALPVLKLGGNTVHPSAADWSYENLAGTVVKADTAAAVSDTVESYKLEGALTLSFSVEPDYFGVKVTDQSSGEVLFEDLYEAIASLNIDDSKTVLVELSAKWYEDAERSYFGEQAFAFAASMSAPAAFYAGTTTPEVGEFICVTAVNVQDPSAITLQSQPDIGFAPTFFAGEAEGVAYALIPFNWDLSSGDYTLTFAYGSVSQPVNITLKPRANPFKDRTLTFNRNVVEAYGTEEARQKYADALAPILADASATRYFEGSFLCGGIEDHLSGGFGHNITVSGSDIKYRHDGVDYALAADTNIQAVNAGTVLYAGYLDYSGYTVVVEHGYGLKSIYCHMSNVSVEVGQTVAKGDAVGTAGASGFTSDTGVHVALYVYDVPVCQYTLWDSGNNRGIPVYEPGTAE